MTLSPLAALAGAGLGTLAAKAAQTVAETLSFADVFQRAMQASSAGTQTAEEEGATESSQGVDSSSESLEALRENAEHLLEQFQQQLKIRLAMRGIDPAAPVALEIDELGMIRADASHPDRASIEQLLADDESLADMLHEIARQFAALRAAEQAASTSDPSQPGNAESYAGDAFSRHEPDASKTGPKNFRLLLVGDEVQVELT